MESMDITEENVCIVESIQDGEETIITDIKNYTRT